MKQVFSLASKTIIVTGASRGVGREIALKCAKKANVVLIARSGKHPSHHGLHGILEQVAEDVERVGGNPMIVEADIRNSQEIIDAIIKAKIRFDSIDCLVNNASALCTESSYREAKYSYDASEYSGNGEYDLCFIRSSENSSMRHVLTISFIYAL